MESICKFYQVGNGSVEAVYVVRESLRDAFTRAVGVKEDSGVVF